MLVAIAFRVISQINNQACRLSRTNVSNMNFFFMNSQTWTSTIELLSVLMKILLFYAGKRKFSLLIIVAIVAPIVVALLLLPISYYFLSKRARKNYNAVPDENGKSLNWLYTLFKFLMYSNCYLAKKKKKKKKSYLKKI